MIGSVNLYMCEYALQCDVSVNSYFNLERIVHLIYVFFSVISSLHWDDFVFNVYMVTINVILILKLHYSASVYLAHQWDLTIISVLQVYHEINNLFNQRQ